MEVETIDRRQRLPSREPAQRCAGDVDPLVPSRTLQEQLVVAGARQLVEEDAMVDPVDDRGDLCIRERDSLRFDNRQIGLNLCQEIVIGLAGPSFDRFCKERQQ